jgi:hypothetical protein
MSGHEAHGGGGGEESIAQKLAEASVGKVVGNFLTFFLMFFPWTQDSAYAPGNTQ